MSVLGSPSSHFNLRSASFIETPLGEDRPSGFLQAELHQMAEDGARQGLRAVAALAAWPQPRAAGSSSCHPLLNLSISPMS